METENSEYVSLCRLTAFKEMMGICGESVNSCKSILATAKDIYKDQVLKKATENWEEHSEWNRIMQGLEEELTSAYQNLNYWTKLFTDLLKTLTLEQVPLNFLQEYKSLTKEHTDFIGRTLW